MPCDEKSNPAILLLPETVHQVMAYGVLFRPLAFGALTLPYGCPSSVNSKKNTFLITESLQQNNLIVTPLLLARLSLIKPS